VKLAAAVSLLLASSASADRPFPWTWTSSTQPLHTTDVELWLSGRSTRLTPYDVVELRGYVSTGPVKRVDVRLGLETELALQRREQKALDGRVAAIVRYRFLDPTDVLGLALMGRGAFGIASAVMEGRLVLDRVVGDVLFALASSFERTIFWDRRDAIETRLEHGFAMSLRVNPDVTAGVEVRARQALKSGEYQGTAFYGGPTLSIVTKWAWFSVGAVVQFASHKAAGDKGNGQALIFRDDERFGLRLIVGTRASSW
jgi:hypothetical protein